MKTLLDSITNLYSSRGGGVVIALASRSKFAQKGHVPKQTSQPVGLWLAGVRIPFPAPLTPKQLELLLTKGACFSLIEIAFKSSCNLKANFY
jgi:hypothetical protein